MPRKIDYELKARAQLIRKDLGKQNAIVNAIRKGNIDKAEILSGEELVPRNPIYESLVTKQKEIGGIKDKKDKDAVLTQLRAIVDKPDFDYNKICSCISENDGV